MKVGVLLQPRDELRRHVTAGFGELEAFSVYDIIPLKNRTLSLKLSDFIFGLQRGKCRVARQRKAKPMKERHRLDGDYSFLPVCLRELESLSGEHLAGPCASAAFSFDTTSTPAPENLIS